MKTKRSILHRALATLALLGSITPATLHANLLVNPGFESGLTGWGTAGVVTLLNGPGWWIHSGNRSMNLNPAGLQTPSGVLQSVVTPTAGWYEFGVFGRISSDAAAGNFDQFQISAWSAGAGVNAVAGVDPNAVASRIGADGVHMTTDWIELTGSFWAPAGASVLLNINFQDFSPAFTGVIIDDAYLRAPEPASIALLGLGLVGLGALRRPRTG